MTDVEEPHYLKRKEFIGGYFIVGFKEWYGDYGEQIESELSQIYSDTSNMCYTFDTVFLLKTSLNYVLEIGGDYEDFDTMTESMRKNKSRCWIF